MATKLFLRNTTTNGITDSGDAILYDMLAAAGAASDEDAVTTVSDGSEIQWTDTGGGSTVAWISGRVPAGGFTLTTTDISIWARESNMNANAGGRYRVFRYQTGGTVTELGGGPFNDGAEFGTSATEMVWLGNVTDQAFSENDRILIRVYITNVGTMGNNFTCTITFNAADGTTGDSFFNIAETVTFKSESVVINCNAGVIDSSGQAASIQAGAVTVQASAGVLDSSGFAASIQPGTATVQASAGVLDSAGQTATVQPGAISITANVGILDSNGHTATIEAGGGGQTVQANAGVLASAGQAASIQSTVSIQANAGVLDSNGLTASVQPGAVSITANAGVLDSTGHQATVSAAGGPQTVQANAGVLDSAGQAATIQSSVTIQASTCLLDSAGPSASIVPGGVSVSALAGILTAMGYAATITGGETIITTSAAADISEYAPYAVEIVEYNPYSVTIEDDEMAVKGSTLAKTLTFKLNNALSDPAAIYLNLTRSGAAPTEPQDYIYTGIDTAEITKISTGVYRLKLLNFPDSGLYYLEGIAEWEAPDEEWREEIRHQFRVAATVANLSTP
jgi:hypothetical protein